MSIRIFALGLANVFVALMQIFTVSNRYPRWERFLYFLPAKKEPTDDTIHILG